MSDLMWVAEAEHGTATIRAEYTTNHQFRCTDDTLTQAFDDAVLFGRTDVRSINSALGRVHVNRDDSISVAALVMNVLYTNYPNLGQLTFYGTDYIYIDPDAEPSPPDTLDLIDDKIKMVAELPESIFGFEAPEPAAKRLADATYENARQVLLDEIAGIEELIDAVVKGTFHGNQYVTVLGDHVDASTMSTRERQDAAHAMRQKGATHAQVAQRLGYSQAGARNAAIAGQTRAEASGATAPPSHAGAGPHDAQPEPKDTAGVKTGTVDPAALEFIGKNAAAFAAAGGTVKLLDPNDHDPRVKAERVQAFKAAQKFANDTFDAKPDPVTDEWTRLQYGAVFMRNALNGEDGKRVLVAYDAKGVPCAALDYAKPLDTVLQVHVLGSTQQVAGSATAIQLALAQEAAKTGADVYSEATPDAEPYHQLIGRTVEQGTGINVGKILSSWTAEQCKEIASVTASKSLLKAEAATSEWDEVNPFWSTDKGKEILEGIYAEFGTTSATKAASLWSKQPILKYQDDIVEHYAPKLREALGKSFTGIDAAIRAAQSKYETTATKAPAPGGLTPAQQAAADAVKANVNLSPDEAEGLIRYIYSDAWLAGAHVAAGQIGANAIVAPAIRRAVDATDWDLWRPGNRAAADLVRDGGLSDLLDRASISITSLVDDVLQTGLARLGNAIADGLEEGLPSATIGRNIEDQVTGNAEMIAVTEAARATSAASQDTYSENGIEQFNWLAEDSACPACRDNADGGPYDVGGDPVQPEHPRCRCTYLPVIMIDGENVAPTSDEGDQAVNPPEPAEE